MSRSASPASLRYTPLERLGVCRPVDRVGYIVNACSDQRVLDLGAMDETAWQSKRGSGTWLHEEIGRQAKRVDGIDSSAAVPVTGLQTGVNSMIWRGDVNDPTGVLALLPQVPDVVVAGELIEHLENPLSFLRCYAGLKQLAGKTLILSTPNATALHNVLVGMSKRESTHHDHLAIFSYKTLSTLCSRAGLRAWQIVPYYARFTEMEQRQVGAARLGVRATERCVNIGEWLFPLLSFGYIVRAQL